MDKKTSVLQIGREDWTLDLQEHRHKNLEWTFLEIDAPEDDVVTLLKKRKGRAFELVVCTEALNATLLDVLSPVIETYALVIEGPLEEEVPEKIKALKQPVFMDCKDKTELLNTLAQYFFSGQMGSKIHVHKIAVSEDFEGDTTVFGEHRLQLQGDFSNFEQDRPVLTWQYNIGMYGRSQKLWLEYSKEKGVELSLTVRGIREGSSQVFQEWNFEGNALKKAIEIPYQEGLGYLSMSLSVTGKGVVEVGPLHYRDSRLHYGEYLLGGKKIVDGQNEELYYYFHPGDLKPPLNVYFSGYRSAEGFEGFYMMKKLGAPFLLITDPRLEGGSFYLGSAALEAGLKNVIQSYLKALGFSNQELVLSGLSMGTFGALYYGSFLEPHSIIVGKPLVHLGTMAEKERIIRPGGFPTSLDILQSITGRQDKEGMALLDQRFWTAFEQADFNQTQFIIAYMRDDDYDDQAYGEILSHLTTQSARVVGKGIPGRHNDNSAAINQWFINHYVRILEENFKRGKTDELRN